MIKAIFFGGGGENIQISILPFSGGGVFTQLSLFVPVFEWGWILKTHTVAILCNIPTSTIRVFWVMTISTLCRMAVAFVCFSFDCLLLGERGQSDILQPLSFFLSFFFFCILSLTSC